MFGRQIKLSNGFHFGGLFGSFALGPNKVASPFRVPQPDLQRSCLTTLPPAVGRPLRWESIPSHTAMPAAGGEGL